MPGFIKVRIVCVSMYLRYDSRWPSSFLFSVKQKKMFQYRNVLLLFASYKSLWPRSNNRSGISRIYSNIQGVKVNSWPRVKRCVTLTSGTDRLLHTSHRIIASFPAAPSIPLLDDTPLSLLFHMTARPVESERAEN